MVDTFVPKMQPPLTPAEMEALKTPQMQPPAPETASPFATTPNAYGEQTVTAQDTAEAEFDRQLKQDDYSYSQYWSDIAGSDWATTMYLVNSFGDEGPDPNWNLTSEHAKRWKESLPEYMWGRISYEQPMSEKQFNDTITRLQNEDKMNQRLATVSGWGEAGRMGLGMLDPAEIIAGVAAEVATGGTASFIMGPSLLSKGTRVALGATSNAALGVGFNAMRDKGDLSWADYGWSMGFDAMLGGIFGHIDGSMAGIGQKQIQDIKLPKSELQQRIDRQYAELNQLREDGAIITATKPLSTGELTPMAPMVDMGDGTAVPKMSANTNPGPAIVANLDVKAATTAVETGTGQAATKTGKPVDVAEYGVVGYHGSSDVIDKFQGDKTGLGRGVFFSAEPSFANRFATGEAKGGDTAVMLGDNSSAEISNFVHQSLGDAKGKEVDALLKQYDEINVGDAYKDPETGNKLFELSKQIEPYLKEATTLNDGAPNMQRVRLKLGKTFEYRFKEGFDWDEEEAIIKKAREEGYDSVTFSLKPKRGDGPDEVFYSILNDDNIVPFNQGEAPAPIPTQSSVGAAQVQSEAIRSSTTNAPELTQADAPQTTALDKGRVSVLGQSMRSESPMERLIMPHLGEDAVGRTDGSVTPISTAEWARQRHTATEAAWNQAVVPAFREWQDAKGVGMLGRMFAGSKEFDEFSRQVYDYIEDTRPDAATHYHPSVVKAGNKAREIYADYAKLYQNPGLVDGRVMRSIAGAEKLKPDPFYVPKIADREAIDELTARYGEVQIKAVVRRAVEDAMTSEGYDIKPELMDKVAEGWFRNISKAGYGAEDGLAQILAGRSKSRMHEVLGAAGIDEDTVREIVAAMDAKDAKTPRLKNRTPINYRYSEQVKNLKTGEMETFRPLDFFESNMHTITMAYSRRAAGEVAFGRLRIKDPTTTAGLMVDGITSRAEFEEKILKPIADDFQRRGGGEKGRAAAKAAQDRAEFLYKATMGLPLHEMDPTMVKAMRRVRDYNFLRLMNAMGITQTIEFGRQLSMVGFRATLANVPSLKRIIDPNNGSILLKQKMARELEMWGVTENDYWIGAAKHAFQEERLGEGATKAGTVGHYYDKAMDKGKEVLAYTSFQRPVHSRQQQWASRAAVQWFADNARDMKKFAKFKDRIADLGLDEADMKRIHDQIVKYAEAKDPSFKKITAMNFDQWDDIEIRAKFLSSIRRYTNRIIQVNEPGNLPMFFSHPVAQTFLQFRTFSIAAYDKSTLWHMKHHDQQAIMVAMGDIAFGAATFALMTTIRAANRDDRDEYLAEQLSPANLALMGFARGGISSVIPMLADTALMFTPFNPLFMGSRTSGTATDALGGSAPIDLMNSIAGSTKAFADSIWTDRELSQQELRGMQRSMPYSNAIPTYLLFESMIRDRERMAPRQER